MSISPDLYAQLQSALLRCGPFHSDRELRAMFADARISLWREQLPEVDNSAGRVRAVIDLLRDKRNTAQQNGLVLLLQVLADQSTPEDTCHHDLTTLAEALASSVADSDGLMLPITEGVYKDAYQTVYHNLPQPDYGRFIGREEELAKVAHILRPYPHSQHAIVTIDGIGGIGKSTLALEIAHRYLRNYEQITPEERFEAIIWTSAKQSVLTAEGIRARRQVLRTLKDIYTTIAVALEREDITRAHAEEQDNLVRKALTRQRTLLIVDNLETVDDEAVLDFIREIPAPTKVMVTTRHRIDVAYPIRLMGMPEQDGLALIALECQKKGVELNTEQSQRLFERTGGVPLAIVWSIALLGYGYSVDAVLRRLGESESDISRFCFEEVLYSIRGKPAYQLLLALAMFSNGASRDALGYVANLSELDRNEGLVELERLSLVNKNRDRFMLLPLTKVFSTSELQSADDLWLDLRKRFVDYFRRFSNAILELEAREYCQRYRDIQTFTDDGPNLLDAVDWALELGQTDDVLVVSLAAIEYLIILGDFRKAVALCKRALDLGWIVQDRISIARFANLEAWILVQLGDLQAAEELGLVALQEYEEVGNIEGSIGALLTASTVYRKQGHFKKARELSDRAWNLVKDLGTNDLEAWVNDQYGKIARDAGEWESAWEYFTIAARLEFQATGVSYTDERYHALYGGQLALVAYHLGKPQEAKDLCLRTMEATRHHRRQHDIATLTYRLALAEEALGENDAARKHAQEALDQFDRLGMKLDYDEARILFDRLQ